MSGAPPAGGTAVGRAVAVGSRAVEDGAASDEAGSGQRTGWIPESARGAAAGEAEVRRGKRTGE